MCWNVIRWRRGETGNCEWCECADVLIVLLNGMCLFDFNCLISPWGVAIPGLTSCRLFFWGFAKKISCLCLNKIWHCIANEVVSQPCSGFWQFVGTNIPGISRVVGSTCAGAVIHLKFGSHIDIGPLVIPIHGDPMTQFISVWWHGHHKHHGVRHQHGAHGAHGNAVIQVVLKV
jgi:hypothetical protein